MNRKILDKKLLNFITIDRVLGIAFMYLLVFGVVYTVDYWSEKAEDAALAKVEIADQKKILIEIARPASDYIEYTAILPSKAIFDSFEDISFTSYTIRKESAFVHWNDILYCDANGDGTFAYIYRSESSKYLNVSEVNESVTDWYFTEPNVRLPRVSSAACFILSEQQICPPTLADVEGANCKIQEIKSGGFIVSNRDTQR